MAVDDYGPDGNPIFLDGGAPDTAVDPTEVGKYAADRGTRIIRPTMTELNNYAFKKAGLLGYSVADAAEYRFDGSGWARLQAYASRSRATTQSVPNNQWTTVLFTSDDGSAGVSYASGVFAVPATGSYLLQAQVAFAATNTDWGRVIRFFRNGSQSVARSPQVVPSNTTYPTTVTVTRTLTLNAGDTITVDAQQTSGVAVNIGGAADQTYVSIQRVG